jgi:phenylpropionate dioxygenase-like ring-hydroxylating dioxygenase large terminal subunit
VRNKWYPIAPCWPIKDKPVGMLRLGDLIVVWRDGKGKGRRCAENRSIEIRFIGSA